MQPHVLSGPENTIEALQPQGASPVPIIRELLPIEWPVGPAGRGKAYLGSCDEHRTARGRWQHFSRAASPRVSVSGERGQAMNCPG